MSITAMKQMVEALELLVSADPTEEAFDYADNAITAGRQAIEQAEKRQWVGLTNNDLQPIAEEYRILFGSWVHDFARAIEAKLKEKNT